MQGDIYRLLYKFPLIFDVCSTAFSCYTIFFLETRDIPRSNMHVRDDNRYLKHFYLILEAKKGKLSCAINVIGICAAFKIVDTSFKRFKVKKIITFELQHEIHFLSQTILINNNFLIRIRLFQ